LFSTCIDPRNQMIFRLNSSLILENFYQARWLKCESVEQAKSSQLIWWNSSTRSLNEIISKFNHVEKKTITVLSYLFNRILLPVGQTKVKSSG